MSMGEVSRSLSVGRHGTASVKTSAFRSVDSGTPPAVASGPCTGVIGILRSTDITKLPSLETLSYSSIMLGTTRPGSSGVEPLGAKLSTGWFVRLGSSKRSGLRRCREFRMVGSGPLFRRYGVHRDIAPRASIALRLSTVVTSWVPPGHGAVIELRGEIA